MLTAALLSAAGVFGGGVADAEIPFVACHEDYALACGHLAVPLSPTGAAQGTLTLTLRRRRATVGEPHSAVIALAGGPGQAAIPFTEAFAELLGPVIATRDLIVFDQRGTGLSSPLRCAAFKEGEELSAQVVKRCAEQIGERRGFYTTQETVADIEAIRVAGGYEKLVLYGTSYGTKVALAYAEQHPSHVEALVLDSVVPPQGPEPLHLDTFAAVPRVLRRVCAFHGCAHITPNLLADLRRLIAHMHGHGVRGHVFDGKGRRHTIRISSIDLLALLVGGDLDPVLRAEYPAAIRAAAEGETAPLARLLAHAGNEEEPEQLGDPAFDTPLYYATVCEEEQFPWNRAASPRTRLAEGRAKLASLPARAFAPFTAADAFAFGEMGECADWPFSRPAPPRSEGALPAVPTLIVSGAEDLRTPTSGARAIAAQIPGSHLLVIPNTGHSALTTEPTDCGVKALHALFESQAIASCPAAAPPHYLRPTPLAPRRLSQVPPEHGYRGRPGRTAEAVELTLRDLVRQLVIALLEGGPQALGGGHLRTGGLHRGWAGVSHRALVLKDYSYVPGVLISGWIRSERAQLNVGGRAAAHGRLSLRSNHHLVGELGDVAVDLSPKKDHDQAAGSASAARFSTQMRAALMRPMDGPLLQLVALAADAQSPRLHGLAGATASMGGLEALAYAISHSREGALR